MECGVGWPGVMMRWAWMGVRTGSVDSVGDVHAAFLAYAYSKACGDVLH